ncbi:transcription factor bHLH122-like, partial [Trifolium medium]|nr:transcription factor bHLH122-like [Trifolium medium]
NETGGGHSSSPLAHQLSMPNTSSEMAAMEKFLHFSDSVPMKIRAKRASEGRQPSAERLTDDCFGQDSLPNDSFLKDVY